MHRLVYFGGRFASVEDRQRRMRNREVLPPVNLLHKEVSDREVLPGKRVCTALKSHIYDVSCTFKNEGCTRGPRHTRHRHLAGTRRSKTAETNRTPLGVT